MAAENITLGAGELWFGPFKTGTLVSDGMFPVGNCESVTTTPERRTLEHRDSRRGILDVDAELTIETMFTATFTTDNIRAETFALMMGLQTSTTKTVTSGSSVADNTLLGVKPGRTYQIGKTTANPSGARSITSVVVTNDAGSPTTYVAGDDYTLDLQRGLITIVVGGDITTGTNLEITYNQTAHTRDQIVLAEEGWEGELKFFAYNSVGSRRDLWIPRAKLIPTGEFSWVTGEDWQKLSFTAKALQLDDATAKAYIDGLPVV